MRSSSSRSSLLRSFTILAAATLLASCADPVTAPPSLQALRRDHDPNPSCHLTGDYGAWYPDAPSTLANSGYRLLASGCDVANGGFNNSVATWQYMNRILKPQGEYSHKVYVTVEYRFLDATRGGYRIVDAVDGWGSETIDQYGFVQGDPQYSVSPSNPPRTVGVATTGRFDIRLLPEVAGMTLVGYTAGCNDNSISATACFETALNRHDEPQLCIDNAGSNTFTSPQQLPVCGTPIPSIVATTNRLPVASLSVTSVTNATSAGNDGAITAADQHSSDPEGQALTYAWSLLDGAGVPIPGSQRSSTPASFPNLAPGTYRVRLAVTDPSGGFDATEQTVTVAAASVNRPPVAVAALVSVVQPTRRAGSFTVSGTNSYDPDGDPITYEWTVRDAASNVVATAPTASATFSVFPGTYTATLIVRDAVTGTAAAPISVVINAPAPNVSITGPSAMQPYASCTFSAALNNSTEPNTITWYVSTGGPFLQAETGSSYAHYAYPGSLTIRAVSRRADGSTIAQTDKSVSVSTSAPGC